MQIERTERLRLDDLGVNGTVVLQLQDVHFFRQAKQVDRYIQSSVHLINGKRFHQLTGRIVQFELKQTLVGVVDLQLQLVVQHRIGIHRYTELT